MSDETTTTEEATPAATEEATPAAAEDTPAASVRVPLHEDVARFLRQRLRALAEGRDEDAATILAFIQKEFGKVRIADVEVGSVPEHFRQYWRDHFLMPESVQRVTVLVDYAREPVWSVPRTDGEPSWMEVPMHLQQKIEDPLGLNTDWVNAPEHLLPRQNPRPLPRKVMAALRLPVPTASSDEAGEAGEDA